MIELKRISYVEYYNLQDKSLYDYVARFSRVLNTPNDLFEIGPMTKLTFGQVKDAQTSFANGVSIENMINFVADVKKQDVKGLAKHEFFELCKARKFIEDQIEKICTIEGNLSYDVTNKDKIAGIENLSKFGVMIQIDTLAKGKIWMYDKIKAIQYDIAFAKMLMDKETNEYNIAISKLDKPTNN